VFCGGSERGALILLSFSFSWMSTYQLFHNQNMRMNEGENCTDFFITTIREGMKEKIIPCAYHTSTKRSFHTLRMKAKLPIHCENS